MAFTPKKIKDILDAFHVTGSGEAPEKTEVVDASKVSHISEPTLPILPWHIYLGKDVPKACVDQVRDVREMLAAFKPGVWSYLSTVQVDGGVRAIGADTAKCVMFTDTTAYRVALAAEIGRDADKLKAAMTSAITEPEKTNLRIDWMRMMTFKHLMKDREGPLSAVNTYDGAIITWGMGWAFGGGLPPVLSRIFQIEKASGNDLEMHYVQKMFYLAGFMMSGGKYWALDTAGDGKVFADPVGSRGDAYRVVHDTQELHWMWVQLAHDDETRPTLLRAQREVFFEKNGKVAQAEKVQTAALHTFLAHLQHWTGDTGMGMIDWATGPYARPQPVQSTMPSEKADAEIAIQAAHRFYWKRDPGNSNPFRQVRKYWREMTTDDAADEGTTEFAPVYPIMTAPPVGTVPDDHLAAKITSPPPVETYDLGPLTDFCREPFGPPLPPGGMPTPSESADPGTPGPNARPSQPPPAPAPAADPQNYEEPSIRCFAAGTRVECPSGPRAIEALSVGDEVWTFDERTGNVHTGVVTRTFAHPPAACLRVHLQGGAALVVTENHPVFARGGWVVAGALAPGDVLLRRNASGRVERVEVARVEREAPQPVYNLSVAEHATYFAEGVLVHNKELL